MLGSTRGARQKFLTLWSSHSNEGQVNKMRMEGILGSCAETQGREYQTESPPPFFVICFLSVKSLSLGTSVPGHWEDRCSVTSF